MVLLEPQGVGEVEGERVGEPVVEGAREGRGEREAELQKVALGLAVPVWDTEPV